MPTRLLRRRFWTPLVWAFAVLIMLGLAVLAVSVESFVQQQHRTDELAKKNAALVAADARMGTNLCKLATALALYQPNLDPEVVRTINDVIGHLPPRCFAP